ncbi:SdpI family protein [Intestinimonas sp.]|uniref:SdpI family protein n=1 Tax=Intestinimonas sp. TaxID=1965293 RepID=UPI00260F0FFD|nr:SdpI family protein [Intestinimonas sp.]
MDLLIPVVMLLLGRHFLTRPPKTINDLYGYRTARSMKNQSTWDFAHRTCGRLWFRLGLVLLPLSALVMLPVLGADTGTVGLWCGAVALVQTVVLLGSIFPVEQALKKEFDQFGKKR